ncbi:MAG: LD-carboxypeptidase [Legionella sp.]|uniref:S66 peptidase family protein n=1 Tax=Legionella sp. TaxID=459 RepID=UPI0039E57BA7
MNYLAGLKTGDAIELIAPASRCSDAELRGLLDLLESWGLRVLVSDTLFGKDLLCANSDEQRFLHLKNALYNPESKAIICVRGGYGATRLLPQLTQLKAPAMAKIFVGMSDITCLHLYLQQHWHWPTVHGSVLPAKLSAESLASLKSILFAQTPSVVFNTMKPLNQLAQASGLIQSQVIGGNLTLVQASIGTRWQMNGSRRFILLEDVGERGYRVDRMLEHLQQANLFQDATAIIFGDFLEGKEPNGSSLIQPVLERFAAQCPIPVVQIEGVGHGRTNFPIPLGTDASLQLGVDIKLTCQLGIYP